MVETVQQLAPLLILARLAKADGMIFELVPGDE
jgi:hypothetical protein